MNEKLTLPIFRIVSESAESAGLSVWVVGGYVRDLFLARESKDIDFVTVGDSIALAEDVAKRLGMPNQVNIFKNFGTAHIKSSDWDYEFVGARKESYLPDSRKPIVSTGTLEDDQNRRDFTINALAISLDGSTFGELTDPFKGMQDLHDKIIRTPLDPDITFSDDPLRMLRAIRFAAQLGFTIEPVTYEGIRRNAHRIDIVSPERISDELNKMIDRILIKNSIWFFFTKKGKNLSFIKKIYYLMLYSNTFKTFNQIDRLKHYFKRYSIFIIITFYTSFIIIYSSARVEKTN